MVTHWETFVLENPLLPQTKDVCWLAFRKWLLSALVGDRLTVSLTDGFSSVKGCCFGRTDCRKH